MIDNLDINLFYTSEMGDYTFSELINGKGWIQTDDLDIHKFYHAQGGLELKMDRIFLFFKNTCAEDHFEAVLFLLQSILEVSDFRNDEGFDRIKISNSQNSLPMPLGRSSWVTLLFDKQHEIINIQYLDLNNQLNIIRNNPYFDDIRVDFQIWKRAAILAIEEYFKFINQAFSSEIELKISSQYLEFFSIWKLMKSKLGI
jgi:hypothetical protein